jgi:membrane protein DedA with SNARE-associated domain
MEFYHFILYGMLAVVKFIITPFTIYATGKDSIQFGEVVLTTATGAAVGVLLFYYGGTYFFKWTSHLKSKKTKPVFTKGRRRIVFIKNKFGLVGFIAISAIISVPITSLLAAKFFKHNRYTPLWLICGFLIWSLILSSAAYYIKWL